VDEYLASASPLADFVVGTNGALVIDVNVGGPRQRWTLTGNVTIATLQGFRAGVSYELWFKQDATGSRTVTWPSSVKWAGGVAPTITVGAGTQDRITLMWDPANAQYLASATQNYH